MKFHLQRGPQLRPKEKVASNVQRAAPNKARAAPEGPRPEIVQAALDAYLLLAGRTNMLLRMSPEEHAALDQLGEEGGSEMLGVWKREPRKDKPAS